MEMKEDGVNKLENRSVEIFQHNKQRKMITGKVNKAWKTGGTMEKKSNIFVTGILEREKKEYGAEWYLHISWPKPFHTAGKIITFKSKKFSENLIV